MNPFPSPRPQKFPDSAGLHELRTTKRRGIPLVSCTFTPGDGSIDRLKPHNFSVKAGFNPLTAWRFFVCFKGVDGALAKCFLEYCLNLAKLRLPLPVYV